MTYTYDEYTLFPTGYAGGVGHKSARSAVLAARFQISIDPSRTEIVIRRPDNKPIFFYHPILTPGG